MTRAEKTVAALVAKMDVDALRDLAALALRGVDAVALLTETAEERTRRLDRERKKRTRVGRAADTDRTLAGRSMDNDRTNGGQLADKTGTSAGQLLESSRALSLSSSSGSAEITENTEEKTKSAREGARTRERREAEEKVFAHWLTHWCSRIGGTRKPALDAKRRARIAARLKAGDTVETLCRAIDGIWMSEFHVAGGHTDVGVALRDDSQVAKFVAMAEGKLKPDANTRRSTLQGHGGNYLRPPSVPADNVTAQDDGWVEPEFDESEFPPLRSQQVAS